MKLRVVSSKSEIDDVSKNEQMVHLAFRASNTDIFKLFQNCPRLRAIQVPASYRKTLSRASEMFLDMQGVELIEGDVWGHRKDINEYYTVDDSVFNRIEQLREGGANTNEIASTVSKETKLSPELVKYVIKQTS
ncbi:MAG: DUF1699 family protein [Methanotrichaceae archaeon]|nr:DUF1699 family protein [Methanotrichaceae archaeon]MDD1758079.1 DUF1699 family protein [Methanotrichaceae archaeon]